MVARMAAALHRVVTEATIDTAGVGGVLEPRSDMVLERPIGPGLFEAAEGPVTSYRRQVVVETGDGGRGRVSQTVEFRLAVPWVGWLFLLPARRHLGSLEPPALIVPAVVAAGEVPAGARAYSFGILVLTAALGAGLCAILLTLADIGPGGWRALYLVPVVGLILLIPIARKLPESRRFVAPHAIATLRGHGWRLWLLASSRFLLNLFLVPATQHQNQFLRAP